MESRDAREGREKAGADRPSRTVNYYDVLDVDPGASRLEIREAYLRLKSAYNGEGDALYSLMGEHEAQTALARIEEAYKVLGDDQKRREFDREMGFPEADSSRSRAAMQDVYDDRSYRQTERLTFMREQGRQPQNFGGQNQDTWAGASRMEDPEAEAPVVKTTRSTLQVFKTKATKSEDDATQTTYKELIENADPGDGDLYRQLREAAGVSEEELADRTKVSLAYIRAIEANRFELLPQSVFVKGFLRSYLRYLLVPDVDALVDAFSRRLGEWQATRKD